MPRGAKPPAGPTSRRIAAILNDAAKRRSLTQVQLGVATGISQSQVSLILTGQRAADVDQLQAICDALGLSIRDVVAASEDAD